MLIVILSAVVTVAIHYSGLFYDYFKKPNTEVLELNSTVLGAIKKIEPITLQNSNCYRFIFSSFIRHFFQKEIAKYLLL